MRVRTWTETSELAGARRVLTTRGCARGRPTGSRALEGTPASIARQFGVSWSTVWAAVERAGRAQVEDPDRVGPTAMVGFDETVMQPAHRRRRRRFVTAVVDVGTGQILDVFEGRNAVDLRIWLADQPPAWRAQVQVVSVDPHEGYRSALTDTRSARGRDGRGRPVPHRAAREPDRHPHSANASNRRRSNIAVGRATRSTTSASSCCSARNASTRPAGNASTEHSTRATPTTRSATRGSPRRRSATSTSPTTPTKPPSASTMRSPGAPNPKPDPSSAGSRRRCAGGAHQILAHHTPARATVPSKPRTCSSSRSSDPAAGSATSPTTASGSCSPAASPATLNPSRDSEPDPGQPRRAQGLFAMNAGGVS